MAALREPGQSAPSTGEDATGMPYVPVPVLHRGGLVGPPPTQHDVVVDLARCAAVAVICSACDMGVRDGSRWNYVLLFHCSFCMVPSRSSYRLFPLLSRCCDKRARLPANLPALPQCTWHHVAAMWSRCKQVGHTTSCELQAGDLTPFLPLCWQPAATPCWRLPTC